MGTGADSGGAVRAADAGAAVSSSWKKQGGGVRKHAYKRGVYSGPYHHLLRPHHHLSHRHWRPYLHWLDGDDYDNQIFLFLFVDYWFVI